MEERRNKKKRYCFEHYCISSVLFLTFMLFSANGFAQYFPAPTPVSPTLENQLLLNLKQSTSASNKIRILLNLSNLYYNKPIKKAGDLDEALSKATQARDLSLNLRDTAGFNDSEYLMANILMLKDDLPGAESILKDLNDSTKNKLMIALVYRYLYRPTGTPAESIKGAEKYLALATELSNQRHDRLTQILCLNYKALLDAARGYLKKTEKELNEVIVQYRSIGYTKRLQYVYYWLSKVNMSSGNFDKALFYSLETIKAMKLSRDTLAGGDFYLGLAIVYRHLDLSQQVIDASLTAISYYSAHAAEGSIFDAIGALNVTLIRLHRNKEALSLLQRYLKEYTPISYNDKKIAIAEYGNCYLALKRYAEAEKYYLMGYNMDKDSKSLDLPAYQRMGYFYIEIKSYAKAKPYLDMALAQLQVQDISIKDKIHLHFMAFLADSAAGDYLSAIKHLRINNEYDHTVYEKSKTEAAEKLQVQFETEKKNHAIQILTQRDLLQQANLKQANLIRNITIGGILVMIMISLLFYKNYRQKQKANNIITHKNELLQHLLTEKEWLLKEVHHRVKNNLHTVICLLESQAAYLENDALKAIESSQHRIYAMSLIHQKLYQSDDIKTIDMSEYIPGLVQSLEDSFDTSNQIEFKLNIDPINLGLSHAIPLGLIINEAVTNSIKYAFPGKRKGEILISMADNGGQIKLELADNGIGMPQIDCQTEPDSLGMELMKGLSEDIDADISFKIDNGTKIVIIFKRHALNDPDSFLKSTQTKEIYV